MYKTLIFTFLCCFISACGQDESKQAMVKINILEKELSDLKDRVELNEIIGKFSSQTVVYLTPGGQGYSVIRYDLGSLTIRIEDVVQYAGGVKVVFKMGNPLMTDVNGLNADVEYGEVDEKGALKGEEKKKKVKFEGELKSGSWGKNTIILEGVELSKFGYIRVRNLTHTGIKLRS
jgi:hypothetical protein